jgi:hypothetical protein
MLSIDTIVMTVHDADPLRARFHSTTETYGQLDMLKDLQCKCQKR